MGGAGAASQLTDDKPKWSSEGAKRAAPAAARNRAAIAEVLREELPAAGLVLEIASGSGEHALWFAEAFPALDWLPSDCSDEALASARAWRADYGGSNLLEPIILDAASAHWPIARADAILCINMVHISSWSATEGLFTGAARRLDGDAPLIVYGPYFEEGIEPVPSNVTFDDGLRQRDGRWGIRNLSDMDRLGERYGLARSARHEMPANNLTLIYRRV